MGKFEKKKNRSSAKEKSAKFRVIYDKTGNTLNVWFGDPKDERASVEASDGVVLSKDGNGRVIGFEKLNFLPKGATFSRKIISVMSRGSKTRAGASFGLNHENTR